MNASSSVGLGRVGDLTDCCNASGVSMAMKRWGKSMAAATVDGTGPARQIEAYDPCFMSEARIIDAADLMPRPWKNGGGVTWEIAIDKA